MRKLLPDNEKLCYLRLIDGQYQLYIAEFPLENQPSQISVSSPNGSEKLKGGTDSSITWSTQNIGLVTIEYSTDAGANRRSIAENIQAPLGAFAWTVPPSPSSQCLVRISNANNANLFDVSDGVFSIETDPVVVNVPDGVTTTINAASNPDLISLGLDKLEVIIPDQAITELEPVILEINIAPDIPQDTGQLIYSPIAFSVEGNEGQYDFAAPVTISIPYPASVTNEDALTVMIFDEASNVWAPIDNPESIVIDKENNIISFQVTHFSIYGIYDGNASIPYETKSVADAAAAGWINLYSYVFDGNDYIIKDPLNQNDATTIEPWKGFWTGVNNFCRSVDPEFYIGSGRPIFFNS